MSLMSMRPRGRGASTGLSPVTHRTLRTPRAHAPRISRLQAGARPVARRDLHHRFGTPLDCHPAAGPADVIRGVAEAIVGEVDRRHVGLDQVDVGRTACWSRPRAAGRSRRPPRTRLPSTAAPVRRPARRCSGGWYSPSPCHQSGWRTGSKTPSQVLARASSWSGEQSTLTTPARPVLPHLADHIRPGLGADLLPVQRRQHLQQASPPGPS